jgi:hypothetical protein
MSRFFYLECPSCEWDCVIAAVEAEGGETCPLCAEDNGQDVYLRSREAQDSDRPEGWDARAQQVKP